MWYILCLVAQLCPTLCNPMDYSPPGSPINGDFPARILEWVAMPSSRGSSQPRKRAGVSCIAGGFFAILATREAQEYWSGSYPFSRGASWPRKWTMVPCIAGRFFTSWATREAPCKPYNDLFTHTSAHIHKQPFFH